MNDRVILGQKYEDAITGFTGSATARTEYVFGTPKVRLEARAQTTGRQVAWFDESRLLSRAGARLASVSTPDDTVA